MTSRQRPVDSTVAAALEAQGMPVDESEVAEVARRWVALLDTGQVLLEGLHPDGSAEFAALGSWTTP